MSTYFACNHFEQRECDCTEADKKAYARNAAVYKPGLSSDTVCSYYDQWVSYDEEHAENRYRGPRYAADAVNFYLNKTTHSKIGDIGSGSGLVGKLLQQRGYTNIVAIDRAHSMLRETRRAYCEVLPYYIGPESKQHVADDIFDCVVAAGSFGLNHIQVDGINELIRIVKEDGIIVIVMREDYLADFKGRMDPYMEELEECGYWTKLERTIVPDYWMKNSGVVYAYKVHLNGFKKFDSVVLC